MLFIYCSITVYKKILATSTIPTVEEKDASPLRLKELQSYINELNNDGEYLIEVVATYRNKQMTKWLREKCLNINHQHDSWNFFKTI